MSYIENLITDYYNRINRERDDSARDHDSTFVLGGWGADRQPKVLQAMSMFGAYFLY